MALLIGGVSYADQEKLLDRGVDVLIATPGRLMDHFERGRILLNDVKVLVIDEADRMLDMGFLPSLRVIFDKVPAKRHTMLFSATMGQSVAGLVSSYVRDPVWIAVEANAETTARIDSVLDVIGSLKGVEKTMSSIILSVKFER